MVAQLRQNLISALVDFASAGGSPERVADAIIDMIGWIQRPIPADPASLPPEEPEKPIRCPYCKGALKFEHEEILVCTTCDKEWKTDD